MKDLGYVEGRDFVVEIRWAEGHPDRLPDLAADLVRAHVDIIVTAGTPATKALKQATQTIPIVVAILGGAVEKGIVASLARPGGNVTGLSFEVSNLAGKVLQLFKEAVPTLRGVVYLYDPAGARREVEGQMRSVGQAVKVEMQLVALRDPDRVTQAFAEFKPGTNGLLLDNSTPLALAAEKICALALQRRLPAVAVVDRLFPNAGCLMSYGENIAGAYRGAAAFVDKIIKGAKPADLPVEQPTKFDFVINLKTAKALGLTIPPSLLLQADQVIQ
jgi:putative ABC transport system substrate-binding protein